MRFILLLIISGVAAFAADSAVFVGNYADLDNGDGGIKSHQLSLVIFDNGDAVLTMVKGEQVFSRACRWQPTPAGITVDDTGRPMDLNLSLGSEDGEPTRLQRFDGENAVSLRLRLGAVFWVDGKDVRMPDGSILVGAQGPAEVGDALLMSSAGGIVAGNWTKGEGYFTVAPK